MTAISPFHRICDALGAKQSSEGYARAVCPVHGSKTGRALSVSIRDRGDGSALIHCHAGCDWRDILGAIGMQPWHLYGERAPQSRADRRASPPRLDARELLDLILSDVTTVWGIASELAAGNLPSSEDCRELMEAERSLRNVRLLIEGSPPITIAAPQSRGRNADG